MTAEAIHRGAGDVLLVVDVQNDFCAGGALAVPRGEDVVPTINRLASRFEHVILTQDWHPPGHLSFASSHPGRRPFDVVTMPYGRQVLWPDHCVQGSDGAALHPGLDVRHAQLIIRKGYRPEVDSYSALYENDRRTPTGLAGYLRERGLDRIFIAGLAFDYCVRYSATDAQGHGFAIVVLDDGCRGLGSETIAETRRVFAERGIRCVPSDSVA